jgi:hypothetical protein
VGFSTLPSGNVLTKQNGAGDNGDNTNSDANVVTGLSSVVTLVNGEVDLTIDAGIAPIPTATVGDYVWFDANRNGLQGATEEGVPGVLATLLNSSGVAVGTSITDGTGKYLITNVPADAGYTVKFTSNIPGFGTVGKPTWTSPNLGINGAGTGTTTESNLDSDPSKVAGPTFGVTGAFVVNDGDNIRNVDGGISTPITLTGNVWHDINGMADTLVNNSGQMAVPPVAPIPVGLRAYLVNPGTGLIVKSALVSALSGVYVMNDIEPSTNYYIILSKTPAAVGTAVPQASLPGGWINTGEKLGITLGNDGVVNGRLNIPGSLSNIINANFGIKFDNGEVVIP